MTPLTATRDEARRLDDTETILITGWSWHLTCGQDPHLIAALIAEACQAEPRLGLPMEPCSGRCGTLVDDRARDEETGMLWCGPQCRDDALAAAYDRWCEASVGVEPRRSYEAGWVL